MESEDQLMVRKIEFGDQDLLQQNIWLLQHAVYLILFNKNLKFLKCYICQVS